MAEGQDAAAIPEAASPESFGHVPVLLDRADELLGPALEAAGAGAIYVDATLGLGGHSEHFLRTYPGAHLIGLDRDPDALAVARRRLAPYADRTQFVHTRYDGIADALASCGLDRVGSVHAILFDLGVSSMQLDETERGFAYSRDAPLDMRMDPTTGMTAADVLNTYSHGDLARILSTYGEERFAGKIASEIVRQRAKAPLRTSGELVELLYRTIPAASRRTGGHPAKRTFQALRVEVNGELDSLRAAIPDALDALAVGGRVVFMSYQSLEDRVVKQILTPLTKSKSPEGLPVELPGTEPELRVLTRGAERATEQEIEANPRSAPVRLRAAERIARRYR
ncbi:ribosomal RNA small subunit methyltransferase H [Rhodococcus ruber Chol-4]|uniref:Ribosomal RNA small subunit methyltransferase H n=1 Tax=Rhodococcus ruber TaxID=1830 RepID=A0A098BLG3_9NOCA|nr:MULTISPECIES: 16S rRNA (cytosine(1402)-N(4))-methyltransferase RsmH [Rhodococcus]MDO2380379.1 16S rRNA (cytosine(1402)-N(4))-methyltransferase RsmH [Rhodococcus ruber]NGR05981.1 16S rRNA (cytosine(1402)-N(4))-methyltransferase RsmH [bacterium SGD-2]RIK12504.1 MAG: 16S rRNA (cytosine(1402)-N(4))-methyltransferase RsmH [Acidobacteriota bacterium]ATQ28154.1 16S rRNA (cytosine(1402)-N(4))-methyltransferase RsmH [Rhodococcus ruber]AWG99549.1 16S rRNA (cytosine(1402)-N(4))-methyltransferase RsmH 